MPTASAIYRIFRPPVSSLGLHPGSCRPLGVRPPRVPLSPLCPACLPMWCAASHHLLDIGFSGCSFRARTRGQGTSTPWLSLTPVPGPPPPSPSPLAILIPSLLAKSVGRHARMYLSLQIQRSSKGLLGSLDQGPLILSHMWIIFSQEKT